MKQRFFHFNNSKTYNDSDYIVTECNSIAYNYMMHENWISNCTIISGPPCCGKTHLTYIWAQKHNAFFLTKTSENFRMIKKQNIVIHNFFNFESNWETSLLHIYNNTIENAKKIVITSNTKTSDINFKLMDLKSRIISAIELKLSHPDEIITEVILSKLLHEKQIKIEQKLIRYILEYPGISTAIFDKVIDKLYDYVNLKKSKITTKLLYELIRSSF